MTAKPVRQPAPPAGLVDSLQAEVAAEASPLMLLLVAHARKIAFALVLFIIAIGGYWFYASHIEKATAKDAQDLGAILIIPDTALRLERLEAYTGTAPASVRHEAWFALAGAAGQTKNYAALYKAWETIEGFDPALAGTASLGMANALAQQGKYADALAVLDKALPKLKGAETINANVRISLLAEAAGDYARAVKACDAILASPEAIPDARTMDQFGQKKAWLEDKLTASK